MKILLTCFLLFFAVATFADDMDEHHGHRKACKSDREKFCKDVQKGGGKIMNCLKEHENELSADCKTKIQEMSGSMNEMHEKCKADHEKFCKDVKPGEGRIKDCMMKNKDKLSDGCKTFMNEKMKDKK